LLQAVVERLAVASSRESPNRRVLIMPAPLQALVGAVVFAITLPMMVYVIWSRWPTTAYWLVGAGIFVVYLLAFALGLLKPYRR
jgi:hypothetical protein